MKSRTTSAPWSMACPALRRCQSRGGCCARSTESSCQMFGVESAFPERSGDHRTGSALRTTALRPRSRGRGRVGRRPDEGMRAPHVPEEPVPILTPDDPHREDLGQPGAAPGQLQCPALLTQGQQQVPDQHRPRCPGRGRADQDAGRDVVHDGRGDVTQGRRAAGAPARGACTRPAGYGRRRCGARSSRGRRPGSRRRCVLRPWPR